MQSELELKISPKIIRGCHLCLRNIVRFIMGKAKKTRKFGATKRLLNANKDTRLKAVKSKITKNQDKNKSEADGELIREMYFIREMCFFLLTGIVRKLHPHYSFNITKLLVLHIE